MNLPLLVVILIYGFIGGWLAAILWAEVTRLDRPAHPFIAMALLVLTTLLWPLIVVWGIVNAIRRHR